MNPIDHPMGGGEGAPRRPASLLAVGQLAKGLKTRENKRTDRMIVKRRGEKV
jgi:large subunit ribosomal protein L2